jgi:transposase-like protein
MNILKPKPNCPVCGSPNANGYHGVAYDDLMCIEPMECDDCGATWNQLWVRGGIDDIEAKNPLAGDAT